MKKYISVSLVLFAVFFGATQAHAMTLGEFIQQEIGNLGSVLQGSAIDAVAPATSNQDLAPLPTDGRAFVNKKAVPSATSQSIIQQASQSAAPSAQVPASTTVLNSLSYGQTNDGVKAFQQVLVTKGLLPADDVTGYYGPATVAAAQTLQAQNGIVSTGKVVGPKTQAIPLPDTIANQVSVPASTVNSQISNSTPSRQQSCDVDVANNSNTCSGLTQVAVVSQENQQSLVKVTLDPSVVGANAKVRFDVSFNKDSDPDGWNVDIGDSATNDGYAGDANTQSNDAEMQILSSAASKIYNFQVFGNDNTPASDTLDGHRSLKGVLNNPSLAGKTVSFIVGDQYLKYDLSSTTPGAVAEMKSSDLYALSGESDFQGSVNYDIYAGFNRVVAGNYRYGTGVAHVHITILGSGQDSFVSSGNNDSNFGPSSNGNDSSSIPGCFHGALFSSTTGARCQMTTQSVPGCNPGFVFSSLTGQKCPALSQNPYAGSISLQNNSNPTSSAVPVTVLHNPVPHQYLCALNSSPTITITSPSTGQTYAQGQQMLVTWTDCGVPTNSVVDFELGDSVTGQEFLVGVPSAISGLHWLSFPIAANTGSATITLPTNLVPTTDLYTIRMNVFSDQNSVTASGIVASNWSGKFSIGSGTQQTCSINPVLVTSSSTVSQYVAAGTTSGVQNTTKATFNFTSSAATTITELKFTDSAATAVQIGNVTAPFVGGTADLMGLNIAVPQGTTGANVDVYVSYPPAGIAGIASGTTSAITLTYIKFLCGNTVTTATASITAPQMIVTASKPTITLSTPTSSVLTAGDNELADITISADANGPIIVNQVPVIIATTGNVSLIAGSPFIVKDSSNQVVPMASGAVASANGGSSNITFTPGGYIIGAGQSQTFKIFGLVASAGPNSYVSTGVGPATSFSWTDSSSGNLTPFTSTNYDISNYPTGVSTIHN